MDRAKLYSVLDVANIPLANRDVNGVYFLRTPEGYKIFRVEDSPSKPLIPLDLVDKADKSTTITGVGYLTGGGDLSVDREIDIHQAVKDSIAEGATAYAWGNHATAGYSTQTLTPGTGISIVGSTISSTITYPPGSDLPELNTGTETIKKLHSSKDLNDWLDAQNIMPPNNNIVIEDGNNTILEVNPTFGNTFVAYGVDNLIKLADPVPYENADVVVLNRTKGEVFFDGEQPQNMLYVSNYDRLYPPHDPANQPTGEISGLVLKAVLDDGGGAFWLVVSEIRILNI